jgi:hypothetical protein
MNPLYAFAISAAVLTSWSAVAETTVSTTSRSCKSSAYGPSVCTETTVNSSVPEPAKPREISALEERLAREAREARIRKWEDFCKPAGFIDEMGITRLRYAHTGCDLGRSSDGSLAQVQ